MSDVLHPEVALLVKLGSIAVHVEELLSPSGHILDRTALCALLNDPEVQAWKTGMDKMALLPVKR